MRSLVGHRVRDGVGNAMIAEALCQLLDKPDCPVGGTEQHDTAVRADRAAVESAHKFAPARASELHLGLATLSASGSASLSREVVVAQPLSLSRSPGTPYCREKFTLDETSTSS